jgi:Ca2+-binding RTX toxin-like protein
VVDLAAGTGSGGDQLTSIENIDGGAGDDVLTGDAGTNVIWGAAGADRVDAGAGDDYVFGGAGPDELRGGAGNDVIEGDGARGGTVQTTPSPAASDLIDGGDGIDAASWAGRAGRVVVDLSNPGPDGEPAAPDTLARIENVEAGAGHNTLIGDDRPNVLDGSSARGTIIGNGGDDTLLAGGTSVTVDAGAGDDIIRSGSTRLRCGSGFDLVEVFDRKPLKRACEAKAFMSGAWDPIRRIALTPLLELRNAIGTMTLRSVSVRVRCPLPSCRGALRLSPQSPRITDGFRRINLKRGSWRTLRIPLNAIGRRRAARHNQQTMWLSLDLDSYAPVELRRAR